MKAKKSFDLIKKYLKDNDIPFEIDKNLVRGLDYYSGIVFEYHYTSSQGKDYGALGGGGHYNNLVKEVGGPDLEGVGFAFGIERLVSLMSDDNLFPEDIDEPLDFYVMPMGNDAQNKAFELTNFLRINGYNCDVCLENKGMGQMFKKAERRNALYAIIIGDDEVKGNKVNLKNLASQEQKTIKDEDLLEEIDKLFGEDEHDHDHE